MSDLTAGEKRRFERLLGMSSGYVLDFSNRTFADLVTDSTGRDIYDAKYDYGSGSKANRLRGFWNQEPNNVVGKLMAELMSYGEENGSFKNEPLLLEGCRKTVTRLLQNISVPDLDALTAAGSEKDFEIVAKEVRETIEKNQPETGLDRLHTYVVKYVRSICLKRGIRDVRDKALHALFGEYVRKLRDDGCLESEMTERILKSSISILESFNHVRNNQSLAHDNPILNYDEALLIFTHLAASVRFLRGLEAKSKAKPPPSAPDPAESEEFPF